MSLPKILSTFEEHYAGSPMKMAPESFIVLLGDLSTVRTTKDLSLMYNHSEFLRETRFSHYAPTST